MRRAVRNIFLLGIACLAGAGTSELLYRSSWFRTRLAPFTGRGELLAIVQGIGIYEADRGTVTGGDLESLVVTENLRRESRHERIAAEEIERELRLMEAQFGEGKAFAKAVQESKLSIDSLRQNMAEHLRARAWLEKQIAPALHVGEEEIRANYETKRDLFTLPARFRARHVFLAAHDATPPEVAEQKRKKIEEIAQRIAEGENVGSLAAELSEDEATKKQGGDLGFFSGARVPAEFFAQVKQLQVGRITPPFQSHLGFHIAELTDLKQSREMSFEEVQAEIATTLANEKRFAAVKALRQKLAVADFVRTPQ